MNGASVLAIIGAVGLAVHFELGLIMPYFRARRRK